ncbi:MAG: ammonium transporter [Alphaproteobacteria bacterium]|nr:ammonium transporter [Alphaproteobacteria bacterium]MCB9929715.1 ammonium transporter [Alphaproteobacteria bacterium]
MLPRFRVGAALTLGLLLPLPAFAQDALNSGDTAWIIVATALVLFMTLPGLALFYAGLVQSQSVLSVIMHCFAIACLASVLWLVAGYSLAFGDSVSGWIGNLDKAFFAGVTPEALHGSIPEIVFAIFQMTFAIITPGLIVGAYPERMKFSAVLWVSGLWLLLVYAPVCHWVWGGGWMAGMGVMDFAGGIVVHATAGISAVVIAVMLGARRGFPEHVRPPHNPGMTATGAAMLWVGWYGFNGGSQLAADGGAGMAIAATHIAAATAALTWSAIEWVKFGKPSVVGAVTGVIAGLATVTPASGFVGPMGGLILGLAAGFVCFYAVQIMKFSLKLDDSLDVFAVHGVGGILGSLLLSVLALAAFGGRGLAEGQTAIGQLGVQAVGVGVTLIWSAGLTFLIVKVTGALTGGLRVTEEQEIEGLDLAYHGERGYDIGR